MFQYDKARRDVRMRVGCDALVQQPGLRRVPRRAREVHPQVQRGPVLHRLRDRHGLRTEGILPERPEPVRQISGLGGRRGGAWCCRLLRRQRRGGVTAGSEDGCRVDTIAAQQAQHQGAPVPAAATHRQRSARAQDVVDMIADCRAIARPGETVCARPVGQGTLCRITRDDPVQHRDGGSVAGLGGHAIT